MLSGFLLMSVCEHVRRAEVPHMLNLWILNISKPSGMLNLAEEKRKDEGTGDEMRKKRGEKMR